MKPEFRSEDDLFDILAKKAYEVVYLIGSAISAASRPDERGVPNVKGMIDLIAQTFTDPAMRQKFHDAIARKPKNRYQAAFDFIGSVDSQNAMIRRCVLQARNSPPPLSKDWESQLTPQYCESLAHDIQGWYLPPAVNALGRILARAPSNTAPIVLTSNFDPLMAISVRRHGGYAFSVAFHGDSNIGNFSADGCLIVHFHGHWYMGDTLHTPQQLARKRPQLQASLGQLLSKHRLVVLGYGGWNDEVMRSLTALIKGDVANYEVDWAFFDDDDDEKLRERHAELLKKLKRGISRGRISLYKGVNVHRLLKRLADSFGDGRILGDYRLFELVHQGTTSKIWKAVALRDAGSLVAIKLFSGGADNSDRCKRFFDGAEQMARVEHPAFARTLLNRQQDRNDAYYVMEWIEGRRLGETHSGKPCPEASVKAILIKLAEALGAAHHQGVIHRDISPRNILLDDTGQLRIVGFDTVRASSNPDMTNTAARKLSFHYAPPEVLARKLPPDIRADIYSLALVGLFLLLGKDPPADKINHMSEFISATEICGPVLRSVLERACARSAADRYASMGEFSLALQAAPAAPAPDSPYLLLEQIGAGSTSNVFKALEVRDDGSCRKALPVASAAAAPLAQWGPHKLIERIAVGGMAEVYKAVEANADGSERTVAIKRILPHLAGDDKFITMFKDEARIASQLEHKNIAQFYCACQQGENIYYMALEYIAGKDLHSLFTRCQQQGRPMPLAQACFIVMEICKGLDYAHNKRDEHGRHLNIVHRDICPPNILVSYEGDVKLIDFGIVKAAGRVHRTQSEILMGKPGYLSPEQVRGMPIDRRKDVFSLGIVLYEILVGNRLFRGDTDYDTLMMVYNLNVPVPSSKNSEISKDLETIIMKSLSDSPETRYQTAMYLHDELQAFMSQHGIFYNQNDLAAWMRKQYAREIELERGKSSAPRSTP